MKKQYLKPTNLYQEASRRLNELRLIHHELKKRLNIYPEGKIHVVKNRLRIQYYLRKDPKEKSGVYLSKKEEEKIKTFLQKKYDEDAIKQVNLEIKILENILKKNNSNIEKLRKSYSDYPQEVKKHIIPIDVSDEDYVKEWLSIPYIHKPIPEEVPVYLTDNGERVRSKSELNIANMLYKMNVPYKYECPLTFSNGRTIHPDFTLLDIRNRREIYWEHRGMMDDRNYLKHTVQRVKDYRKEGIHVGENLLITEETSSIPLGTDEIESVIQHLLSSSEFDVFSQNVLGFMNSSGKPKNTIIDAEYRRKS